MSPALTIQLQDKEGHDLGGLIFLDQGNRQHTCDWFGGCTHHAVVAVMPSTKSGAPQLACGTHLPNIFLAIWRHSNPPRLIVKDAHKLLARNEKVGSAQP